MIEENGLAPAEMTPARARVYEESRHLAQKAGCDDRRLREPRVVYVTELMRRGLFVPGETYIDLSAIWNLHPGTCRAITSEASRRLMALTDGKIVQLKLATALDARLNELDDIEDGKERADATATITKAYAPLVGANVDKGGTTVNILGRPEVEAALRGALSVVEAILDRLHPGTSDDVRAGLQEWQTGGSAGLEAWMAEQAPMMLEAGDET